MSDLKPEDFKLIEEAAAVIRKNYDAEHFRHTVGAAVRCSSGKVYAGVNIYSLHGACAEVIAIGAAVSGGEHRFECIVAIGGEHSDQIYPPCGNCRQMLSTYMPNGQVIVENSGRIRKVAVSDLLPFAYSLPED